jgi:hypothetical protein
MPPGINGANPFGRATAALSGISRIRS